MDTIYITSLVIDINGPKVPYQEANRHHGIATEIEFVTFIVFWESICLVSSIPI